MLGGKLAGRLDERRVKYWLAALFAALALPAAVLIVQAYGQLKWEAFRSTQLLAVDLAARIDAELRAAAAAEEARSFGDYSFLVVEGDAAANFVQRSPLSVFPVASSLPGVIGYFQVDAAGTLTTPLLPAAGVDAASYGIGPDEQQARAALVAAVRDVLAENRLVQRVRAAAATVPDEPAARAADVPPAEAAPPAAQPQAAFDRLAANSRQAARALRTPAALAGDNAAARSAAAGDAAVRAELEQQTSAPFAERQIRREQELVPEPAAAAAVASDSAEAAAPKAELRVRTFESELDPFEVGLLDTGHLVMFRNVWRDGRRYVQGALLDRERFVADAVAAPLRASSLAGTSGVEVAFRGGVLATLPAASGSYASAPAELAGSPLYRSRLSPPFGDFELVFAVGTLPRAPGSVLLAWLTLAFAAVLAGGFWFMQRLAVGQLRLARQQQDFVSAVSHELKTPLTSIRMYGEMLKAGWADDAKKQTYYDYIHSESERLSRLIENVLQLARLTRNAQRLDLQRVAVGELMALARSKVATQAERAGFTLELRNDAPADAAVLVDADAFAQIVINLVDNALKFSAGAQRKVVQLASRRETDGTVLFAVRDFGPGIPKGQMKKIFELFYRPQNELTRETAGTGIGLALVRQLAAALGARVDVRNCEPGAEFRISFPP